MEIHWREWGAAALAEAQARDLPLLIQIRAEWDETSCAMDEVYTQPNIIQRIEAGWLPVRVSVAERPDLAQRYRPLVLALTGESGPPLTVFAAPDGRAFFGGVSFPAAGQAGRAAFAEVLQQMSAGWAAHGEDLVKEAAGLLTHWDAQADGQSVAMSGDRGAIAAAGAAIWQDLDMAAEENARLDSARYPGPLGLRLLLHPAGGPEGQRRGLDLLRQVCRESVHDHLAGGFFHYPAHHDWQLPGFAKLLGENALHLGNLAHAYRLTGEQTWASSAARLVDWLQGEIAAPGGGFYAGLDSDAAFYTWTFTEVTHLLPREDWQAATLYFNLARRGMAGQKLQHNALYVARTGAEVAEITHVTPAAAQGVLASVRRRMAAARSERPRPALLRQWSPAQNALIAAALLEAADPFGRPQWRDLAVATLAALSARCEPGYTWFRPEPDAGGPPQLADQALPAAAFLAAYEAGLGERWLAQARRLVDCTLLTFSAGESPALAETPSAWPGEPDLPPGINWWDDEMPCANACLAGVLERLAAATGEAACAERARQIAAAFPGDATNASFLAPSWLVYCP
jgi:uncharacterized protein